MINLTSLSKMALPNEQIGATIRLSRQEDLDMRYMSRCLELALLREGRTAPNPVVGSVVLNSDGILVGEGYHEAAGKPHAEVNALDAAGEQARGGTLYVNLEPCSHFGRTPPCSQRVIESGVKRVVIGMLDPNPLAAGGISALRQHGISVHTGVLEEQCQWANRAFVSRIKSGRPWLSLKMATTLDGRIADRNGQSRWITNTRARQYVHELRNRYDCVMIGAATALFDDPQLTVRDVDQGRNPVRVVIDPQLGISPNARLCDSNARTLIFHAPSALQKEMAQFPDSVELMAANENNSRLDLADVLKQLGNLGFNSVLCEGGGQLAGSLLQAGLVDEVHWFIAPKFLVDVQSKLAASSPDERLLPQAPSLQNVEIYALDDNTLIRGTLQSRF